MRYNYNRQNWLESEEAKKLLDDGDLIKFCTRASKNKNKIDVSEGLKNAQISLDKTKISFNEVRIAAQWAAVLCAKDFKMSSLRKIFDIISSKDVERAQFILAYEVARKKEFREFGIFLEDLISKVREADEEQNKQGMEKIKRFLEAVIAYHKLIKPTGD